MTDRRNDLPALGLDAIRLLGAGAIAFAVEGLLESNRLLALVVGALAVDWMARRAGMRWDESGADRWQVVGLRLAAGAGVGAAIALAATLAVVVAGRGTVTLGSPAPVGIGIGVVSALALAARDELLFRGLPLALMSGRVADRWALPFTALLGAAPLVLSRTATATGVVVTLLSGFVFALLWRSGRGMYRAWGAHAGWLFFAGAGVRGMLLDVRFASGQILPMGSATGWPAWASIALFAAGAAVLILIDRRRAAA